MKLGLGIIEGFYGTPWTWEERNFAASRLSELGGKFYIYAPKGDPFLRKRWTETFPLEQAKSLRTFGDQLKANGISFGVGLSPYELYRAFDAQAQTQLERKCLEIAKLGVDHLALLFDDMRGDLPDLASLQIEVIQFVQKLKLFEQLSFCPTYYTPDPILDRVFGVRPPGYLETLGERIDESVNFFWTGPKVCSTEISRDHLRETAALLKRKPFLWDNYPVNDGQRMCQYLHLKEFTGRNSSIQDELSGHAVNPMNEARLSFLPIRSLSEIYFSKFENWRKTADRELPLALAQALEEDREVFQREGQRQMTGDQRSRYLSRYKAFEHPAAREIVRWLDGEFEVTSELVLTQ